MADFVIRDKLEIWRLLKQVGNPKQANSERKLSICTSSTYFPHPTQIALSVEKYIPGTDLKETERILSTSILRFKTSFTWPFSGPCFIFSRPIR